MKNKIASVEKLISVEPHPNADRLDLVKVLGYQCVTERGLHSEGDLIVYIQPDSVLPLDTEWAEGYRKYSPNRIKAVKLRGEYSEGIIVKFEQIWGDELPKFERDEGSDTYDGLLEGDDVAEMIGVTHYEPPLPQDLSAKGGLPFGIPKTDETRWENMISRLPINEPVDITLKIDGQSWSAYYDLESDTFGVMGRTMEYKDDAVNNYTAHLDRYDVKNVLVDYCKKHGVSLCIRGESFGEGIQKSDVNPHSKVEKALGIFSVWNIDKRRYERPGDEHYFIDFCEATGLPSVPVLERGELLTRELIDRYSVGMKKLNGKPFEGVVVNHGYYEIEEPAKTLNLPNGETKDIDARMRPFVASSFKIINKAYDARK